MGEKGNASILGTAVQVEKAANMLHRVSTHCLWGISEAKVHGLLQPPKDCTTARCRLEPMTPALKKCAFALSSAKPTITIGTDPSSGLRVKGPNLSRVHAIVEFMPAKGAIYVIDKSTNGTFVNGKRLPAKGCAKVVLWHGDELLFQDPALGGGEFGYVVNLELI